MGMEPRCLGGLGCLSNWLVGILSAEWESSRIHGASLTMRVSLSEREFALSSDRVRQVAWSRERTRGLVLTISHANPVQSRSAGESRAVGYTGSYLCTGILELCEVRNVLRVSSRGEAYQVEGDVRESDVGYVGELKRAQSTREDREA